MKTITQHTPWEVAEGAWSRFPRFNLTFLCGKTRGVGFLRTSYPPSPDDYRGQPVRQCKTCYRRFERLYKEKTGRNWGDFLTAPGRAMAKA